MSQWDPSIHTLWRMLPELPAEMLTELGLLTNGFVPVLLADGKTEVWRDTTICPTCLIPKGDAVARLNWRIKNNRADIPPEWRQPIDR